MASRTNAKTRTIPLTGTTRVLRKPESTITNCLSKRDNILFTSLLNKSPQPSNYLKSNKRLSESQVYQKDFVPNFRFKMALFRLFAFNTCTKRNIRPDSNVLTGARASSFQLTITSITFNIFFCNPRVSLCRLYHFDNSILNSYIPQTFIYATRCQRRKSKT